MGNLTAKKYPTKLFANAADHTYIECGTGGRAWSCWGGKTGGQACKQSNGSTARADQIAQPNERAGIACYLVNGVCHQAANRILLAANITLEGAGVRGYGLSTGIFGAYGRIGFWPCSAPFNQYANVTGDLPVCIEAPHISRQDIDVPSPPSERERRYMESVRQAYTKFSEQLRISAVAPQDISSFQLEIFNLQIEFRLGEGTWQSIQGLRSAKKAFEQSHQTLVGDLAGENQLTAKFILEFNSLTKHFQDNAANALLKEQYQALFDSDRDERLVLADPEVIKELYGQEIMDEVYDQGRRPAPSY